MSTQKESYAGREAAVLRRLTNIALTNGLQADTRSLSRPDWSIVGTVTITQQSSSNLVDLTGNYYSIKDEFRMREAKSANGRPHPGMLISFAEADIKRAKEIVEENKRKMEADAEERRKWTEYLMRPGPNLAEKIYNRLSTTESAPAIRALAELPIDILEKVLGVLVKEEDAWYEKVVAGSEKS